MPPDPPSQRGIRSPAVDQQTPGRFSESERLLQTLTRNRCVNDGTAESGEEVRVEGHEHGRPRYLVSNGGAPAPGKRATQDSVREERDRGLMGLMRTPAVHYARSGDLHIAYQVVGDGPVDVLFLTEYFGHLEAQWEMPGFGSWLQRLASFSRLILFDKAGTGLSDPVPLAQLPALEHWVEEMDCVLKAASSSRPIVVAAGGSAPMGILFAATHPESTAGLIVLNGYARMLRGESYPIGLPSHMLDAVAEVHSSGWGTGAMAAISSPSEVGDPAWVAAYARLERLAASPGTVAAMIRLAVSVDVRDALPAVSAPTLVIHRRDSDYIRASHGRYLAERIPGARLVEVPGVDHNFFSGDTAPLLAEIQEFVTGFREPSVPDRVLATVLFTDIVRSTERAAAVGDHRWKHVIESHHGAVRRQLERFRGREMDTAGDGFFAVFDSPARAIRCSLAIHEAVRALGVEVRIGVHAGECELVDGKVGGIAVSIGARVAALAEAGEVLVSRTVVDLVAGSGLRFEERGVHALKGVPGEWALSRVVERLEPAPTAPG